MADRDTIGYMGESKNPITVARAIIRIGDAARNVNDYSLLGALHESFKGAEHLAEVQEEAKKVVSDALG